MLATARLPRRASVVRASELNMVAVLAVIRKGCAEQTTYLAIVENMVKVLPTWVVAGSWPQIVPSSRRRGAEANIFDYNFHFKTYHVRVVFSHIVTIKAMSKTLFQTFECAL